MASEHTNNDKRYLSRDDLVADLFESIQAIEGDGSFAAQGDLGEVNPGLEVEGLGMIGMPISPHDIERLCEVGKRGHYDRRYIDSSKINFLHPQWSERENVAIRTMCEQLGVPAGAEHVTARFSCITIEVAGTVPEICEPTESERFGTLQICLPSLHAGGDVTVQAMIQRLFRTPTRRVGGTARIKHSFRTPSKRPISSGQRVTLCYDLICRDPAISPSISSLNSQRSALKAALWNWNHSLKTSSDVPAMLAYSLRKTYEVGQGIDNFVGLDLRRTKFIERVLSECDFSCFIAHVQKEVEGVCSGDAEGPELSSESSDEQSEASFDVQEPENAIEKVQSRSLKITNLTTLSASSLVREVGLDRSSIMQRRLFYRAPDHEETEEQLSSMDELEAEITTHHWSNTALLIIPRKFAMSFFVDHLKRFDVGGRSASYDTARRQAQDLIQYVTTNIRRLPNDTQCRHELEVLCDALIGANQRAEKALAQGPSHAGFRLFQYQQLPYDSTTTALLAKSCLLIGDLSRFENALRSRMRDAYGSQIMSSDLLLDVLEASSSFSFSQLQPRFEMIVQMCSGAEERVEIINTIVGGYKPESTAEQEAAVCWRRAAIGAIFAGPDEKPKDTIPALVECIACDCVDEWLEERAMPFVQANANRPWITLAFLNALFQAAYHRILDRELVNQAFRSCAPIVIDGFTFPDRTFNHTYDRRPKQEKRLSVSPQPGICGYELMKFHRKLREFGLSDLARAFLHKIAANSHAPGAVEYIQSAILLNVHDAMSSPDSKTLFADEECKNSLRTIIRNYLTSWVGSHYPKPTSWSQPPVGCGTCAECRELDHFLQNPSRWMIGFQRSNEIREHLEQRLKARPSGPYTGLKFTTSSRGRSKNSLVIEKTMHGWNTWFKEWNFRIREAHDWFNRANLPDDVREYALQLLGQMTKVDTTSFYQSPYAQTGSNLQGSVTQGQKRGLEEQDENVPPAKRPAEVIDLSDSP